MTEADAPVKEDERVITLEVLGDCNSTFIVVDVVAEEDDLQHPKALCTSPRAVCHSLSSPRRAKPLSGLCGQVKHKLPPVADVIDSDDR